jgi:hypothetical protein
MRTLARSRRRIRGLGWFAISLLLLAVLPAQLAGAALISQAVDNTLSEFTRGTFQRTSLGSLSITSPPAGPQPKVKDQVGAAQLLPIGILKDWFNAPFPLPEKMTDVATVALGNRIFVIGGTVSSGNLLVPTPHIWSATVDTNTGAIISPGWQAETPLPAVQTGTQFITPVDARAVAAVAAVQTNAATNDGYIYVIGGSVRPSGAPDNISSFAVNIARVTNGHISSGSWSEGPRIPSPDGNAFNQLGAQSAAATSFSIGGKTYIYLLGGLQRYREGTGGSSRTAEVGLRKAFYAQVGSNGQLTKPSGGGGTDPVWAALPDIPVPSNLGIFSGLWDGTVVSAHYEGETGASGDALYLMGGQLVSGSSPLPATPLYNNSVYRALIGSNGALTWTSAAGANQWQGTLPEARTGLAAVQFRGKLYVTGGRPVTSSGPQQPQKAVQTSYIEDNLTLPVIGDGGSNFLRNADVLPRPRARHGSVIIPVTPKPGEPAAAFVYVIAGLGDAGDQFTDDDAGSDTVIYGKIGGDEATLQTGFAPSGWYYSKPHDTFFDGAQVQEINWTTVITRTGPAMDIQMYYRISTAANCDDPSAFNGSAWNALDGTPTDGAATYSANSANSVTLPAGAVANCFQYRAKLTSAGAPAAQTPSLLNVSIVVNVPGNPDIRVQTLRAERDTQNNFNGLTVVLQNHSDTPPTQPANIEGGGSFYVDLFIFAPGETVVPPTLPVPLNAPGDRGCIEISKNAMPAEATVPIIQWRDVASCKSPTNILQYFNKAGHYVVYVAIDTQCSGSPFQCLNEGTAGEANNIQRIEFDLPSNAVRYPVRFPIVRRRP